MGEMMRDLRYAVRRLRRSPGFTWTVVLTLATGVGLSAAIFTMVDCMLLRPLGYHDADRIYSLNTRFSLERRSIAKIGGGDYVDVARQVKGFESAAYYQSGKDGLQVGGRSLYLGVAMVSPHFGAVMGVEPVAGRMFRDDTHGLYAMVSNGFAREWFVSADAAVGQTVRYAGMVREIVGVLPDGFSFPDKTTVWIEADAVPENLNRTAFNQRAIGKAKPGVTAAALNAELAVLSKQLGESYPEDSTKAIEAVPLQDQIVGKTRPAMRLLMGSVGMVLLIVCANVTHLQLIRAMRARRENSIRQALGATRIGSVRRASVEVLLLAFLGCSAGVLLAVPTLRLMIALAPADIPRLGEVRLNLHVLVFSLAVSVVSMAFTAILPLWRSWRVDPASTMREDAGRGSDGRRGGRLRNGLIVGEIALTLVLTASSLMLGRQMRHESEMDLGFAPDRLVMLDAHRAAEARPGEGGGKQVAALDALLGELGMQPGVIVVAAASGAPMGSGSSDVRYAVRGMTEFKTGSELPDANIVPVTPDYFRTMGIPILRGRALSEADGPRSEKVLVISRAMAAQSFAGVDPIGKQVECGFDSQGEFWTIVGVAGDVRQDSPGAAVAPTFYVPVAQHQTVAGDVQVMVRTQQDAAAMGETLQRYLQQHHPEIAVKTVTMQEAVGEAARSQRFKTILFGGFAAVSLVLAMIGIYGVTSYAVAQRRFEFALRIAVGAQRGQLLGLVCRSALTVACAGALAGVALSLVSMRLAANALGEMPAIDGGTYAFASIGVLMVALAATLLPAYRASRVDPMQVLRAE